MSATYKIAATILILTQTITYNSYAAETNDQNIILTNPSGTIRPIFLGDGPGNSASNNTVTINGGNTYIISGAWASVSKNNTLTVNNITNSFRTLGAVGSQLDGNTLTINNSSLTDVFGGELKFNNASTPMSINNRVELYGTTSISSTLYGGVMTSSSVNGTIILDTYTYDIVTGNTLLVRPTTQSITVGSASTPGGIALANFSILNFDFSDFPSGDLEKDASGNIIGNLPGNYALDVTGVVNLIPGKKISDISAYGFNYANGRALLIKSTESIVFDGHLIGDGFSAYDFISITPSIINAGKELVVDYGYNWYFNNADAHGNFTLEGDENYLLSLVLADRTLNIPSTLGWNGQTLTKKGTGTLTLDENNTYTGITTIEGGTLQLGDGEAVGSIAAASNVTINSGSVLAVNRSDNFTLANAITGAGAVTQMGAGQLLLTANNTYSGGTNVIAGSLAITNPAALGSGEVRNSTQVIFDASIGSFSNTINGTGDVSFSNGSDVRLLAGLTASDITIDTGSKATIASTNPFEGVITNNGILAVDLASNYVLDGPIAGTGVLNQEGTGQLLLTQANSYSGGTNINAGSLAINNINAVGSGAVNNAGTFVFTGASGAFANSISGTGSVLFSNGSNIDITSPLTASTTTVEAGSRASVAAGQQWTTAINNAGIFEVATNTALNGDVNNNGDFTLIGSAVQSSIVGNLNNAGQIRLETDESISSVLSVTGDYVGNQGVVWFNTQLDDDDSDHDLLKISGTASGQTEVRVRNIDGEGNDTIVGIRIIETGASARDTFYLKDGYVAAGAYDYSLFRREENAGVNWYLTNGFDEDGDGDIDIEAGPTYTPGLGSVIANTIAANALFNMRFEDREGAGQSQLGAKTEDNLWVRYSGGNNKFRALNNQLHTSGHSSAMQIGVGLPSLLESHSIDLGVMAGYGHYKGNTKSSRTERKSSSVVDGYSVGLYGTWYSDPASQSGVYVDSWLLWNHFNNRITGADDNKYSYKSKGITASVEVGKGYAIGELNGADIWMQPQAQVIYQGVRANTFKDTQDVTAKRGSDNVQLRAGVKTYADDIMLGNMSSRPFVEVNYIHNTDHYSVKIDDSTYRAAGGKNIGEIRLGLEGNVLGSHQMWINTGYADGGKHYQDFSIQAGWKYQF